LAVSLALLYSAWDPKSNCYVVVIWVVLVVFFGCYMAVEKKALVFSLPILYQILTPGLNRDSRVMVQAVMVCSNPSVTVVTERMEMVSTLIEMILGQRAEAAQLNMPSPPPSVQP
jgi:hypothetical protein